MPMQLISTAAEFAEMNFEHCLSSILHYGDKVRSPGLNDKFRRQKAPGMRKGN